MTGGWEGKANEPKINAESLVFSTRSSLSIPDSCINLNPVTSASGIEFNMYFLVFHNPTTSGVSIISKTNINNKYLVIVYSASGIKLFDRSFSGRDYIDLSGNPAGHYFLLIHIGKKILKRVIIRQ